MTIDDQLRRLDPARDVPEGLVRSPHAVATLARVTATEPGTGPSPRSHRRKRTARFVLAGIVASAGVAAAPILGTGDAAFATWDAKPRPATTQEAKENAEQCAEWTGVPLGSYEPKVVEVRGSWVMTYLASADGEAQCLRSTITTEEFPDGEGQAQSGPLAPTPAADALATVGVMETSGGVVNTQFVVGGKAGAAVAGVVFKSQGLHVQATVKNGRFTAWWPRRKPSTIFGRLMENTGYNGSPNPDVTITLTDGTSFTRPIKDYDVNH